MNIINQRVIPIAALLAALLVWAGCDGGSSDDSKDDAASHAESSTPTNRIAIPSAVRSNLGVTFAKVERRRIQDTLRAPGRFEYLPTALREYRTMLPGRVDLLVNQFDSVKAGTPLFQIDSPAWRELQKSIAQASSEVDTYETIMASYPQLFAAHERHERSMQETLAIWMARVEKLEALREAGGGRMSEYTNAMASMVKAEADLAEVQEEDVKLHAARLRTKASLEAAQAQFELALDTAASLLAIDRSSLLEPSSDEVHAEPRWRNIDVIEVRAVVDGIVNDINLTNGAWADERTNVVTVVQPDRLRFHAFGLQSDLGVLQDGLDVMIVPPTPTASGNAVPLQSTMRGKLSLGLSGDADDRTVDLFVTPEELASWARPGVTAQLEIVTDATSAPELAIPLAAVQRDGLNSVIFRRAPNNPNEAIRMEADLGVDDGRWVAVLSGLRDGDEVVLDGGFQLMLATSGSIQKGGHFHADGTFHEEEH